MIKRVKFLVVHLHVNECYLIDDIVYFIMHNVHLLYQISVVIDLLGKLSRKVAK